MENRDIIFQNEQNNGQQKNPPCNKGLLTVPLRNEEQFSEPFIEILQYNLRHKTDLCFLLSATFVTCVFNLIRK